MVYVILDNLLLLGVGLLDELKFPFHEMTHNLVLSQKLDLIFWQVQCVIRVSVVGPVSSALGPFGLLEVAQHEDYANVLLVHHSPEVLDGIGEGALCGDDGLAGQASLRYFAVLR